jgi:uncharacterized membrane protein (UPF0127 family)
MLARLGCVALLLTGVVACKGGPILGEAQAQGALVPLTIRSGTTVHKLRVEIARTESEQARGLMFRESLPADGGMIFPMKPPRMASFWMKNTVIPLDMIFIREDGTIARIAADTVPYSLEPVDSGEPVAAVLELAGGKAATLGVAEDDVVTWDDK